MHKSRDTRGITGSSNSSGSCGKVIGPEGPAWKQEIII